MNKPHHLLIFFCGFIWQAAQGFVFSEPEKTLEWQHGTLASKILKNLADLNIDRNVVFSPLSVHVAMTLLYLGAEGETAEEVRSALLPQSSNKAIIANDYRKFLDANLNRNISDNLRMASAIVVNDRYRIPDSFYPLAHDMKTVIGRANFSDGEKIVRITNSLVERITNSKINNILEEGSIDDSKIAVFLNALYLKADWMLPFSKDDTKKRFFETANNERIEVDMMYSEDEYRWAKIPKLNATVLELPYKDTDLTMLIVLPDEKHGLRKLEQEIREKAIEWNAISDDLALKSVKLFLPKFKIEFEMDVKEHFEKLGVHKAFSKSADLSGLFVSSGPGGVEKIKHKAFLEVNEAGTEAAAATVGIVGFKMGPGVPKIIRVDHPFFFVIRNRNGVFFMGHVAKP